ncbi:hypothetical protein JCM16303_000061 [Sporobolomyces ruberrimus]
MKLFESSIFLATLACLANAQTTNDTDTTEERNIAGYTPGILLAVVGIATYGLVATMHWIHFFRNRNNKYMITLCIGMTCMIVGFALRILFRENVSSIPIYSGMTLFLLLSPCTFLAINYVLLTRLASALKAEKALFIRASWVVKIFIWSDVVSFLLLSGGGGMSVSQDLAKIAHAISIVGLVLQIASYALFCALLIVFGIRVPKKFPQIEQQIEPLRWSSFSFFSNAPINDWRILFALLIVTSMGITVRCWFRLIEYSQGFDGYLATHEAYFYLLDALPLLISMALYAILWPARFIEGARTMEDYETLDAQGSASYPIGFVPTESNWSRTNYDEARYGKY